MDLQPIFPWAISALQTYEQPLCREVLNYIELNPGVSKDEIFLYTREHSENKGSPYVEWVFYVIWRDKFICQVPGDQKRFEIDPRVLFHVRYFIKEMQDIHGIGK